MCHPTSNIQHPLQAAQPRSCKPPHSFMTAFYLAQVRKRALRARQNLSSAPMPKNPHEQSNPFGDHTSDDDDEPPVTQPITTVSAAATSQTPPPAPTKQTPTPVDNQPPTTRPGAKQSQVARLLQRHQDIRHSLVDHAFSPASREDLVFRAHVQECADDAQPHAYVDTPVEGFGENLLRDMGWSGPSPDATPPEDEPVAPRPQRLGLGASLVEGGDPPPPTRKRRRVDLAAHPLHRPHAASSRPVADAAQGSSPVKRSSASPSRDGRDSRKNLPYGDDSATNHCQGSSHRID